MLHTGEMREVPHGIDLKPVSRKMPSVRFWLVSLEWDERVNARETQDLWHCWNCKNEFTTVVISDEKEPSVTEITKPFFTSLVME
jgi:hypothetical protein